MRISLFLVVVFLVLLFFKAAKRGVILLFLRKVARGALKDIGQKAIDKQPDLIHLVEQNHPWKDEKAIQNLIAPLQLAGFQDAGQYTIPEMPPLVLQFFIKQDERIAAGIYEHTKAGTWVDLFTHYMDGTSFTITSLPDRGLEKRRGKEIVNAPGLNSGTLYRRFIKERPSGPMKEITPKSVVKIFEDTYTADVAWRKRKPITPEEVARVIQTSKTNPTLNMNIKLK
jgi:hypothetical protein